MDEQYITWFECSPGSEVFDAGTMWIEGAGDDYAIYPDLTVRYVNQSKPFPVVAGPFESLDAAKAAYMVLR